MKCWYRQSNAFNVHGYAHNGIMHFTPELEYPNLKWDQSASYPYK